MSPIVLGRGRLADFGRAFPFPPGRAFLVSSPTVWNLHGEAVRRAVSFRAAAELFLEDREASKNWETLQALANGAIEAGIRRDDFVVAVGGGVVTDVAGFAAAIVLRGVTWYAVPTTLLGMADASIGGKTAIDHPLGKNLLGAFHAPSGVLIDPLLLETLPARQFRSGLAEVYKAALIGDASTAEAMAGRLEGIAAARQVDECLLAAIAVKERIVERDPLDKGERRFLNFGHTLGHAIERWGGYERFTHGEGLSVGMAAALDLSGRLAGFSADLAEALGRELLSFAGPAIRQAIDPEAPAIWDALSRDKKFSASRRPAVLLSAIGEPVIHDVPPESWKESLVRVLKRNDL